MFMAMLEALGVSHAGEDLYRALVERGLRDPDELAGALGLSAREFEAALVELESRGLARRQPRGIAPLSAVEALDRHAEEQARAARATASLAREMTAWWSRNHQGVQYADFLYTGDECRSTEARILRGARHEVMSLTTGPPQAKPPAPELEPVGQDPPEEADGGPRPDVPDAQLSSAFLEARSRGVEYRAAYAQDMLRSDATRHAIVARMRGGEQVRIVARLPISLTVVDHEVAVVGYPTMRPDEFHSVLVRPSGLLDLLLQTFEIFWGLGMPLSEQSPGRDDGLNPEDRALLWHLQSGITDAAIARELGISTRTVTRRVARLQDQLGVSSRFQLGAQAHARGWLPTD